MITGSVSDGYIERKSEGRFEGVLKVDGVELSPIEGQYFKKDGDIWLWLKRKPVLEYCEDTQAYDKREREPAWECYMQKQVEGQTVAFKGEFMFMRLRYYISGVWDSVLGMDSRQRLNIFVERMPRNRQTIINGINERKRNTNR